MNKTISINIAGFVFNIEEQAYEILSNYLDSIRRKFQNEEERDEIMQDIESRIAELFHERISEIKEVIIESDVDDVINIMGRPEEYVDGEDVEAESSESTEQTNYQESIYSDTTQKRLFRDPDEAMIGGVCAGIAHYFGMDITIIRVIFVLLLVLGGSGFLLYLILLVVVPEAKSTADKLQMKGQPVNLDNIKEHVNEFKSDVKTGARRGARNFKRAVERGAEASNNFVQAFSKIIGIAFTIGGVFGLIALISVFFGNYGLIPIVGSEYIEDLPTFIEIIYPGETQHTFILIAIILVTTLPVLSILITGVKLLFNVTATFKPLAITGLIIWLIGVGVLVITGIELGMSFRNYNEVEYHVPMKNDSTDVLFIDVMEDNVFSDHIEYNQVWNHTELVKVSQDKIYMGFPNLNIVQKDDSTDFEITVYKSSAGVTVKDAINKAENSSYKLKLKNNRLKLAPYFSINKKDKIRAQEVTVEIQVPLGKRVQLGDNVDRICVRIEGEYYYHSEDNRYASTTWHSDYDGMRCSGCKHHKQVYEYHE